jgi:hypothetical protein
MEWMDKHMHIFFFPHNPYVVVTQQMSMYMSIMYDREW